MQARLGDIHCGYAEVYWPDDPNNHIGFVHIERFVTKTDFEQDEIYKVKRWVPYIYEGCGWKPNGHMQVGRETGYATRSEAVEALNLYIREHF